MNQFGAIELLGCAALLAAGAAVPRARDVDAGVMDFGGMVEGSEGCASRNLC